jgi:hypothetical protein
MKQHITQHQQHQHLFNVVVSRVKDYAVGLKQQTRMDVVSTINNQPQTYKP